MKSERQMTICDIVNNNIIETQEEILYRLKELGYDVTQSTVSRDIRELKLTKITVDGGKQKYVSMSDKDTDVADKYIRVLCDGLLKIEIAQNLLILKTVSGMAMAVAAAIDSLQLDGVVGCIAGDDTIFCAVRNEELSSDVAGKLRRLTTKR